MVGQLSDDLSCADGLRSKHVDAAYRDLRARNNVSVRKSRAKTRAFKSEMINEYHELRRTTTLLRTRVRKSLRELRFLALLFRRAHKTPPDFITGILKTAENGKLGRLLDVEDRHSEFDELEPRHSNSERSTEDKVLSSGTK
ncbi:hypothetical protein CRM22_001688 [Opisthorchis felineus]|uniref:BZIP domain-containing protein n=1 Tax=Opisthorchis felineus TaxID=147828 RepID=A0A4S2MFX5_OPIFE|nr:hypothetical protein CRM22_001688 [Opisthorchis felineus]